MFFSGLVLLFFRHFCYHSIINFCELLLYFTSLLKQHYQFCFSFVHFCIGVRYTTWTKHTVSCFCLIGFLAYFNEEFSRNDIPPFILAVMKVKWWPTFF